MFDAHVHMGYYERKGCREPWYYSPRRVLGVLDRCGVDEFIVSSTCAQVESIRISELNREAREMKRLAGRRAHVFLWVSRSVFAEDPHLKVLDELAEVKGCSGTHGAALRTDTQETLLYEGVKLHELEAHWVQDRPEDLERILKIAEDRGLPVQFHAAQFGTCRPVVLAHWAERFPRVKFDFAHCPDPPEMARVVADHPNVWTDTAYAVESGCLESLDQSAGAACPSRNLRRLMNLDWNGRLMFGTDLPVWQAQEMCDLTERYRTYVAAWKDVEDNARNLSLDPHLFLMV